MTATILYLSWYRRGYRYRGAGTGQNTGTGTSLVGRVEPLPGSASPLAMRLLRRLGVVEERPAAEAFPAEARPADPGAPAPTRRPRRPGVLDGGTTSDSLSDAPSENRHM